MIRLAAADEVSGGTGRFRVQECGGVRSQVSRMGYLLNGCSPEETKIVLNVKNTISGEKKKKT